jgi:hypothetical protein
MNTFGKQNKANIDSSYADSATDFLEQDYQPRNKADIERDH